MSKSYDVDIDPEGGEIIVDVTSPSGIEYEIRAMTLGGYPFYYATVWHEEKINLSVCHHHDGMYIWTDLQEAIQQVKKWR